jgi:hypothetical protein
MLSNNGFNPMLWNCDRQGCFNLKKRPKIELFADCLPGRIAFSDIDAVTEINGNLLFLEWKEHQRICTGQKILFERLTRLCPATVLIIEGDAELMTVESIRTAWKGKISSPQPADINQLRREIAAWKDWALANSAMNRTKEILCN